MNEEAFLADISAFGRLYFIQPSGDRVRVASFQKLVELTQVYCSLLEFLYYADLGFSLFQANSEIPILERAGVPSTRELCSRGFNP